MTPSSVLAEQFDDFEQQRESSTLGMWIFLSAEIIFFGALILSFLYYRLSYPAEFGAAGNHTKIALGTVNTAILLTSSLLVALAVRAARGERAGAVTLYLAFTAALGIAFLLVKFTEYYQEYREHLVPGPGFRIEGVEASRAKLFFIFYFVMTGIHALHVLIGIGLLSGVAWNSLRGEYTRENYNAVEVSGLYWHFVDVVWIFLFPLLYLLGRHLNHG